MPKPWGREPTAWTIDGRVMEVARPPLVDLINFVMAPTPTYLVLYTLTRPEDRKFLLSQIFDRQSRIEIELLHDVADALVRGWFGMPRWTVQEIWWRVLGSWPDVDGELVMRGIDLADLEPARATHVAKALLTKWASSNENRAEELARDLTTEPPRVAQRRIDTADTEEAIEAAAFDWEAAAALVNQQRRT
ncbi:hypothetical protein [Prescottella agglutinans]|uniref:Uncharacterized protein n=1 Tax=Prescottella agglutinans TaxID=1644129 RepID=A0ABT6M5E5_9NOCA|nr:hypothetical protein [Prescottella agglutinans]MDH6279541.1 hypothetical protein [Prescottella agglutinans]